MSLVFAFLLAFVCVFVSVRGEITTDGDVLVLTDANFAEATAAHNLMLVEFYAPWCGHCKTLAPEWAKAATTLKDAPIKLAKVDATENKVLADTNGIKGFPTIKFFKSGVASDYEGGRTEKDIVNWVNKKSLPPVVTITSADDLLRLQEANPAVIVAALDSLTSDVAKEFSDFARDSSLEEIFAVTDSAAIKATLGVTKDTIVVLKNFDEKRNDLVLEGSFKHDDVEAFLTASVTPLVQVFTQSAAKKIFSSSVKKHALLFINSEADNSALLESFAKDSKANRGKLLFISVDETNSPVLNYFGLTTEMLPRLVVADMSTNLKQFPLTETATGELVTAHVNKFVAGELKPHLKSEEPAAEDLAEPVKVIKGKSFNDIVLNNKKDVLVEIYAPWCGHCKKLAPIYDEIAEHFASDKHVVIAKMDGTSNEVDVEGFEAAGYPSLFFVRGDDKKPVKYEGPREKQAIIDYINVNAARVADSSHEEL